MEDSDLSLQDEENQASKSEFEESRSSEESSVVYYDDEG
jgi:hypothetical protein